MNPTKSLSRIAWIGGGRDRASEQLKVHKIENFFDSDFGISLLIMHK